MAQSDQSVQNATFPSVRADVNDNLVALYSQSSGNTAPTVTVAFQPWIDTSSSPPVKKIRNGSNSAWITEGVIDPAGFQVGGVTQIANGGTGATTATAGLAALLPSQTGNAGKALITSGSAATWTSLITLGTAVASTSGTSIDFTSIPSWVKRVTVMFNGVSTSGSSDVQVQLGDSGGVENTGYNATAGVVRGGYVGAAGAQTATSGFILEYNVTSTAAYLRSGHLVVTNISGNIWVASGVIGTSTDGNICLSSGNKTTSATLDRVRITTVNGTDTFDAGSINILYEG